MLETIGYDPATMAAYAAADDVAPGRVARVDRGLALVLTDDGPQRVGYGGGVLREMAQHPERTPCTGDWCVVREWPDGRRTLEQVLPRRTALVRATAGEQSQGQVLCSNVDLVAVVVALRPDPVLTRVERLVALAWESAATPVVVLTKADLVTDAALVAEDVRRVVPGVEVVCTSAETGEGTARVRELVDDRRTMALVGSSGHGKSSLVNALTGADTLTTRAIREDGRGRHTSVRRELVVLPGGGAMIDTPGLRAVGLIDADAGLARTFDDVAELAAQCRFSDCGHRGEPGCAVAAAVADGRLAQRRLDSWVKLQRELAWMASRRDARLRAQRRSEWKRRTRAARTPRR